MSSTKVLLSAEDLHKTYTMGRTEIPVLRGAAFELRANESVAIIGASGAGKSTLLHVLGGLDRPEQGRVVVQGIDVYRSSPGARARLRRDTIGFVFQAYHLLHEMDVMENVMLPAMARPGLSASRARVRRRAGELLDVVGLADRARHRPMELSGGEQQRAALARALMNEPELVLADEPTGNLDEHTGGKVLDHLFELTGGRGHALVLVTHDRRVAERCDRVLQLGDGVVQ